MCVYAYVYSGGITDIGTEDALVRRVQILAEDFCILPIDIDGKGVNLLHPTIGKIVVQTGFFSLDGTTSLGERKL